MDGKVAGCHGLRGDTGDHVAGGAGSGSPASLEAASETKDDLAKLKTVPGDASVDKFSKSTEPRAPVPV
jgi:hypothetical protein